MLSQEERSILERQVEIMHDIRRMLTDATDDISKVSGTAAEVGKLRSAWERIREAHTAIETRLRPNVDRWPTDGLKSIE